MAEKWMAEKWASESGQAPAFRLAGTDCFAGSEAPEADTLIRKTYREGFGI